MGFATAEQLLAKGRTYTSRGGERKSSMLPLRKFGKNIAAVQRDVSNLEDLDRLYAKIAEDKGRVDVVFANEGIGNQMTPLNEALVAEQANLHVAAKPLLRSHDLAGFLSLLCQN